jgi:peptidyl-prolyl cis-trans isomerase SurA
MNVFSRVSFGLLMGCSVLAMPLTAQTVADENTPDVGLNIPNGQKLLGKNNPNVRRATAVVNGDIITGTDVDHRLALVIGANDSRISEEDRAQYRNQILSTLIDEKLQVQEAAANEITITDAEIDQYFENFAKESYKRSGAEAAKYLKEIGSSAQTLKQQIKGELSWSRLLRRNIQPSVNVSENEIKSIMTRIENTKGDTEYRLAEIYLTATPENEEQVLSNAKAILGKLQEGGSFAAYARQFSEASTGSIGGDLGWLTLGKLPETLARAAASLERNQIVAVPAPGGISLLMMVDKRQIATADPRDSILSLKQVSIDFAPNTSKAQAEQLLKRFDQEAQKIKGCGSADEMATKVGAEVVNKDGILVRNLPPSLQEIMLALQIGQSTPAFGSVDDGARVFVLCGRDEPKTAKIATAEEIEDSIVNARVEKRARIYMRDLRRDAVIDYN